MPMVKRVVAVGGDTVACCDPDGRLDGQRQADPRSRTCARASVAELTDIPSIEGARRDSCSCSATSAAVPWTPGRTSQDAVSGSVPRSGVKARVDAVVWPLEGMLARPTGFAALPGGLSPPGPLRLVTVDRDRRRAADPGRRRLRARGAPQVAKAARSRGTEAGGVREAAERCGRPDGGGVRKVARVVLLDPEDRILLMHGLRARRSGRRLGGSRPAAAWRATRRARRPRCGSSRRRPGSPRSNSARCCGGAAAPSRSTGAAGIRTSGTSWPVRTQTETTAAG